MERAPKRPETAPPSAAVIWNRLRSLQSLCQNEEGLLFITGVDGKYNTGSNRVLNFLLFGHSGREVSQNLSDDFEDV
jgi:hypothetical protein